MTIQIKSIISKLRKTNKHISTTFRSMQERSESELETVSSHNTESPLTYDGQFIPSTENMDPLLNTETIDNLREIRQEIANIRHNDLEEKLDQLTQKVDYIQHQNVTIEQIQSLTTDMGKEIITTLKPNEGPIFKETSIGESCFNYGRRLLQHLKTTERDTATLPFYKSYVDSKDFESLNIKVNDGSLPEALDSIKNLSNNCKYLDIESEEVKASCQSVSKSLVKYLYVNNDDFKTLLSNGFELASGIDIEQFGNLFAYMTYGFNKLSLNEIHNISIQSVNSLTIDHGLNLQSTGEIQSLNEEAIENIAVISEKSNDSLKLIKDDLDSYYKPWYARAASALLSRPLFVVATATCGTALFTGAFYLFHQNPGLLQLVVGNASILKTPLDIFQFNMDPSSIKTPLVALNSQSTETLVSTHNTPIVITNDEIINLNKGIKNGSVIALLKLSTIKSFDKAYFSFRGVLVSLFGRDEG